MARVRNEAHYQGPRLKTYTPGRNPPVGNPEDLSEGGR